MNTRIPAEVFPPGEFLREELETRNWSQVELAEILGRPARLISEIISGKRAITPETAKGLAAAFGTSAQYWMNLETSYQLSKAKIQEEEVSKRAKLYDKFPVKEMIKRGWITASENLEVLEQQFLRFFDLSHIDEEPSFIHAAKKTSYKSLPIEQLAWLNRVRQISKTMIVPPYQEHRLQDAIPALGRLLGDPEEVRHVPRILAECGVRFVVVEAFPKSNIDGVCFWLDSSSPVIGMSIRYDRIDNFWFVLRHEIEHVLQKHGQQEGCFDVGLEGEKASTADSVPPEERIANAAAAEFCVSQSELTNFIMRVRPYFSEQRVVLFAQRLKVHPGLVVGQLQRKLDRYDFLKKYQVKIRNFVTQSGMADGWGHTVNIF
ncbi:HigA family addiction module antitoxin [Methylocaldum sp. GT1BB]|jgi:HTH-type transcriptional regulator/antitoxin HigA|uniref:HigA family addiction module antitoxin n=1 Tax=Methylocaldum sp. GT1BB TaxID=3438963 RepID=UPI003DA0D88C